MRVPAATILVALSLALGGCGADADTSALTPAPPVSSGGGESTPLPATTSTGTPSVAATAPATATVTAVAATLTTDGTCPVIGGVEQPLNDPDRLCLHRGEVVLGHAYPDGRGLLGQVARAAKVGDTISLNGAAYRVTDIRSVEKGYYDPDALGPSLLTCDITKGYSADGHSINNLIVALSPS